MNILMFILAYLLGSVPSALIVGRVFFQIDIREHGSNNPGATNTLRVLGKKAAIIVLIVDVGKGALAALLPFLLNVDVPPIYPGLIAVVGHCFPIFAGFKGGKAIATTAGALIVANLGLGIITYLCFFIVIFISKYVFFGSLSVGMVLLVYSFIDSRPDNEIIFIIYLLFLIFLHRTNISRFMKHNEPKINDKNLKNDRIHPK